MINLSNYEQYFLLYIDNELNTTQCEAVEAFIVQYPHVAAELQTLQQAKLIPADTHIFTDKTALFKEINNSISIASYEEYFLLHTDKELSQDAQEETERFILQHPQLQEEFMLLQQAILSPENIECPDKQALYRKSKRIVPLYMRLTAAAVMAGLSALIWWQGTNNNKQTAINKSRSSTVQKAVVPQNNKRSGLSPEQTVNITPITKHEIKQSGQPAESVTAGNKAILSSGNRKDNDRIIIAFKDSLPVLQQPAPEIAAVADMATPIEQESIRLKFLEEVTDNSDNNAQVIYAANNYAAPQPAIYKELNTDNDEQTLYVGALQLNKAKVNGLFKKATHLLGGKAKEQALQQ